ncbi:MAG: AAA family ATPase, partial [Candidatus Eisenbacteria bacterium]|nr:AAA family ATPase [Candidatus Eisenbacteria bacterium]
ALSRGLGDVYKRQRRSRASAAAARGARQVAPPVPRAPIEGEHGPEILLRLEELLRQRIHGKDDAVERIARAVRVRLIHLDFRPERPNGTFLLVGPPGVGKNEFAYALAEILYGDESLVVPIDMRAMASEEDVIRLVDVLVPGPPPTLYEGMLTAPVRRRPHTILLLRGIEQAHPAALRMIQKINEQGWIEDAQGRISFDRTILFATARVPDDENGPTSEIGFNRTAKTSEERVLEKLRRRVSEEFLDSFQEILVLSALSPEDVRQIARYKVRVVLDRLQQGRRGVEVSDSIYAAFIPDEDARVRGAGALNQTLENKLLNPLARYLLEHPKELRIRCLLYTS